MFTILFFIIAIIVIAYVAPGAIGKFLVSSKKVLDETKIVEKFNKTLKGLTERNIDQVKEDLINLLKDYSEVKTAQFSFTLGQIRNTISDLDHQLATIISQRRNAENQLSIYIMDHKNTTDEQEIIRGASLLSTKKSFENLEERLKEAKDILKEKESSLINMIESFKSNLAIKKAEISMMIANNTGAFTGSAIDIKLDNLVQEFQTKAVEQQASADVHNILKGQNENTSDAFSCVEEFKQMIS